MNPMGSPATPLPTSGEFQRIQTMNSQAAPMGGQMQMGTPIQQTAEQQAGIAQAQSKGKGKLPPKKVANPNTSQNSLLLTELRDGMVIMNDGSMRAVISCKSINFDLMSSREREGIEYSYQSFLNSLYFPIQITIRSQRVDIGPYLELLSKIRRDQENMLLGVLMDDYINFVDVISQETNIMDKSFYIVVPYYPSGDIGSAVNASKNLLSNLFAPQTQATVKIDEATYSKAKDELQNRCSTVLSGLAQIGIQSKRLDTRELGELYYNFYNPDTALREPLGNFDPTPAIAIRKGVGNAPQPHLEREQM